MGIPPYGGMGVFSLLCVCLFAVLFVFLYGYGFLSGGKRYGREILHACSTTIAQNFVNFSLYSIFFIEYA